MGFCGPLGTKSSSPRRWFGAHLLTPTCPDPDPGGKGAVQTGLAGRRPSFGGDSSLGRGGGWGLVPQPEESKLRRGGGWEEERTHPGPAVQHAVTQLGSAWTAGLSRGRCSPSHTRPRHTLHTPTGAVRARPDGEGHTSSLPLHHLAGPAPRTLIFTPIHTMPTPRTCMDSIPSPRAPTATRAAHTEHALLEPLTPELHGTPSPIHGRGHSCPPHAPTFRGTPHPGEASQPSRASGSRQPLAAVHATSTRPAPGGRRHAVTSRHRLVGPHGRCAQPRRLLRAPPSA